MKRDPRKFIPPPMVEHVCSECGGEVPIEFESCDAFFLSILARANEISTRQSVDPQLYRLVVDAFGMQHPARSCLSAKSYAAHFTGLCCAMEYGMSEAVYAALQKWLNGPADRIGLTRPDDLAFRGTISVGYAGGAATDQDFEARVLEWGREVWRAYEPQHGIARSWVEEALRRR